MHAFVEERLCTGKLLKNGSNELLYCALLRSFQLCKRTPQSLSKSCAMHRTGGLVLGAACLRVSCIFLFCMPAAATVAQRSPEAIPAQRQSCAHHHQD